ncbi:MAG: FAD-dependent oxidoreductase [Nitrosomonadales bacterium]|nr:FAD-dependent oxidoreductase [Nitrosomonadales bacterium]
MNLAIIGGGYAGMAAAVALSARDIPVTVFESAKQLGGRARGVWHNGTQLDNGQHILLGCYRHTLKLIGQVGGNIGDDFLRLPLQLTLHNRFELKAPHLPAPLHLIEQLAIRAGWQTTPASSLVMLAGLLTAQGLSFAQRFSAARFMLALRRIRFILPRDTTAHDLLRTHNQDEELARLLWEPICIAALNTPVRKASAQVLLNVLRDSLNGSRPDSDILLPRVNFSALFPDRAAEYVKQHGGTVHTSCSVEAIVPHGDTIELTATRDAGCVLRTNLFSHAICAASPASSARLFRAVPQLAPVAAQIAALAFQPIYTVYLQYHEAVRLPHPMLGLDRGFAQWLFDKGRIAGQHGLIAAVISAEGLHQELEHEQLAQKVVQELRERLGITAMPLWHQVIAEKRATFSCEPGLARPAHTTPLSNVLLAGDYTAGDYPATLESAVMSGIQCAGEIFHEGCP